MVVLIISLGKVEEVFCFLSLLHLQYFRLVYNLSKHIISAELFHENSRSQLKKITCNDIKI